jgi:hypothetical protein
MDADRFDTATLGEKPMKFSRILALLLMVGLIVGGTVIVMSWAQAPAPARYSMPAQGYTVWPAPAAGTTSAYPGNSPYAIQLIPSVESGSTSGLSVSARANTAAAEKRPWSADQACGPPDTARAGDFPTAWASRTPDGGEEWLSLTYDPPVEPVAVLIYESCNPGAISTINLYDDQKRLLQPLERPVGPTGDAKRNLVLPVATQLDGKISRIDITLRSQLVTGWNEIDAVGLIDAQGQTHWAKTATASSSFADLIPMPGAPYGSVDSHEQRIARLEQQVTELRTLVDQLQQRLGASGQPTSATAPFSFQIGFGATEASVPAVEKRAELPAPLPPSGAAAPGLPAALPPSAESVPGLPAPLPLGVGQPAPAGEKPLPATDTPPTGTIPPSAAELPPASSTELPSVPAAEKPATEPESAEELPATTTPPLGK